MPLSCNEMPMSVTGHALFLCAQSEILNPPNAGQGMINRIIGKPVRAIARLICTLVIAVIGPFGAIYHMTMAINSSVKFCSNRAVTKNKSLAFEHLKAGLIDLLSIQLLNPGFWIQTNRCLANLMSRSLVRGPVPSLSDKTELMEKAKKDLYLKEHLVNMGQGLYRYDMLVHYALQRRDIEGTLPPLDSVEAQQYCLHALEKGAYGIYKRPGQS